MKRVQAELGEQNDRDTIKDRAPISVVKLTRIAEALPAIVPYARMQECQSRQKWQKREMSGSVADQAKQVRKYKKEYKAVHKKLQSIQKRHKKLLSFNRKNSSIKEFRKIQKKIADSDSDVSLSLIMMTAATSTSYPSVTHPCMRTNETKGKNPKGLTREDKSPQKD